MNKLLLELELIPSTSWFSNVRSAVSRKEWDKIRKQVYDQAYHVCQICGDVGDKHPVECHEIWEFDDKKLIQKLIGMIALCPDCHLVKHMGFATVTGKKTIAMNHFIKVNKLKRKEAEDIVSRAFELWSQRSQKRYKIDISLLESYGIDTHKIKSP